MQSRDPSDELSAVRTRLGQIEEERSLLSPEDTDGLAQLRKEEGELRARLVRLQDSALKDHDTQEIPGVPGA